MIDMQPVSTASIDARVSFIRKTYAHLFAAIAAFVGLEFALFQMPFVHEMTATMLGGQYGWLVVLGAFMFVGWIADRMARSEAAPGIQYLGLGLYVVAEAIIFVPLLYIAAFYSDEWVIPTAAFTTLAVFAGLTVSVFLTKKDFSFLRSGLTIASFLALGTIVAAIVFGFSLGLFFSVIMAALASGYVLYTTSNIIHHYRPGQHVAASLALFSAIALLFWYVLRILMSLSRD